MWRGTKIFNSRAFSLSTVLIWYQFVKDLYCYTKIKKSVVIPSLSSVFNNLEVEHAGYIIEKIARGFSMQKKLSK